MAGATAFKAICGSSPATAATFAVVAVPEMDRYGYGKKLSTGIVAVVGTLGILIPPSVTLIVFGIITEQSIGKLFLAGLVPGLMIAFFFIMIIISIIYLFGGSFIDDLAFMILATPIFYPCIIKLGFDPIWFGMIIAITVMVGVVIPPVAINVFVVNKITKVPFGVIYGGVYPFLISLVVCATLLFIFPQLALWLPNLLMR